MRNFEYINIRHGLYKPHEFCFGLLDNFSCRQYKLKNVTNLLHFLKVGDTDISELLGTPGYLSPEMLKANTDRTYPSYGVAVDMWACGVVLYTLIAGRAPFYNRRVVYMLREIKDGKYSFPSSEWEEISWECKDLVSSLLAQHS